MSEELRSLVSGSYGAALAQSLEEGLTSSLGYRGERAVEWVRREPNVVDQGSEVTLEVCTSPGTLIISEGGRQRTPPSYQEQVFFRDVDGGLRITSNRIAEVSTC